ncbi:peptidase C14 [Epithele typhae]|uniref:peptidase C14 n=1 Tax=Epithele typhae TaxID=378194 RepID=UPI002007EC7F|nr:peptidase C14 [Epithele typhae]KAH9941630.1 peptidase C14 [Epithele typhae]
MPVPMPVPLERGAERFSSCPPSSRPSVKKALIVGLCYNTNNRLDMRKLPGAQEDVKRLHHLLTTKFEYPSENIVIMTDVGPTVDTRWPTRENIVREMRELVHDVRDGDSICFAYSGHGGQVPTDGPEEIDHLDEIFLPIDATYEPQRSGDKYVNFIRDNDVRDILVDHLPDGVRCTMIFDCCHSGTASDLLNVDVPPTPVSPLASPLDSLLARPQAQGSRAFARMQTVHDGHADLLERFPDCRRNSPPATNYVTSWSACCDDQETFGNLKGGLFVKAFYNSLIKQSAAAPTHSGLLLGLRHELRDAVDRSNKNTKRRNPEWTEDDLLVAPRPQLGALLSPEAILDVRFTM